MFQFISQTHYLQFGQCEASRAASLFCLQPSTRFLEYGYKDAPVNITTQG